MTAVSHVCTSGDLIMTFLQTWVKFTGGHIRFQLISTPVAHQNLVKQRRTELIAGLLRRYHIHLQHARPLM